MIYHKDWQQRRNKLFSVLEQDKNKLSSSDYNLIHNFITNQAITSKRALSLNVRHKISGKEYIPRRFK